MKGVDWDVKGQYTKKTGKEISSNQYRQVADKVANKDRAYTFHIAVHEQWFWQKVYSLVFYRGVTV